MFLHDILEGVKRAEERFEREFEELLHKFPHHRYHRKHRPKTLINFFLNQIKISFTMGNLKVPTGTPVTGSGSPLDAKGNVLPVKAFKAGSCKWTTDSTGFTIAPGDIEEDFVITETAPGTASTGNIFFDAQDAAGNQIPQSTAVLSFTDVEAVAVASQIDFDQTSH